MQVQLDQSRSVVCSNNLTDAKNGQSTSDMGIQPCPKHAVYRHERGMPTSFVPFTNRSTNVEYGLQASSFTYTQRCDHIRCCLPTLFVACTHWVIDAVQQQENLPTRIKRGMCSSLKKHRQM